MAHDTPAYRDLRAHVLTCNQCTRRLEALRADAHCIQAALGGVSMPPLRRPLARRVPRGLPLAGGLALVLLALVVVMAGHPFGAAGTAAPPAGRLIVADEQGARLVAFDAATGARTGELIVGPHPRAVQYDAVHGLIFVRDDEGIASIDVATLTPRGRWRPAAGKRVGVFALDAPHARLFASTGAGLAEISIGADGRLTERGRMALAEQPAALALNPAGGRLFAWLTRASTLVTIDIQRGTTFAQLLPGDGQGRVLLAPGRHGILMLRAGGPDARSPVLRLLDAGSGLVQAQLTLSGDMPAWDMAVLSDGRVAVARGDGYRGGVELFAPDTLAPIGTIDAGADQHALAAGPAGDLAALNWMRGTIASYDAQGRPRWQVSRPGWMPRSAVIAAAP
jgi:hypothetical protein